MADFYCAEYKFVIEIDGSIHEYQEEYDLQRDFVMKQKGLKVLRIKNDELKEPEKLMEKILQAMIKRLPPLFSKERGPGGEFFIFA